MITLTWITTLFELWTREWHGMFSTSDETIFVFVSSFPIMLSLIWSTSTVIYLTRCAFRSRASPQSGRLPSFSVLIPFYGNPAAAMMTARSLAGIIPEPDEIIMIDDGSPKECGEVDVGTMPPRTRMIRLSENEGKAEVLNVALRSVRSDIIVCLDSDTVAETKIWFPMLEEFARSPELGAITGNIRPRRVRSLVQLVQAIDYLAVICMVKCAESLWGGLTTVSGAWVAYRREALIMLGGWNSNTCAEDIELSWRMQARGWRIGYDHRWVARVEMARHWKALWLQRRRWSSGLARTLREQFRGAVRWKARHLPVALVAVSSALWMWMCAGLVVMHVVHFLMHSHYLEDLGHIKGWIGHHSFMLSLCSITFTLQVLLGIAADRGSLHRYPVLLVFAPCYFVYFWLVLFTSYFAGFVRGIMRRDTGQWIPTVFEEEDDDSAAAAWIAAARANHTVAHTPSVPVVKP